MNYKFKQEDKVMTTKNNVQKINLRSTLAVTVIILSGIFINARGSSQTHGHLNIEQQVMADAKNSTAYYTNTTINKSNTTGSAIYYAFLVKDMEKPFVIEDWMINESFFRTGVYQTVAIEAPAKIENWMLNDELFKTKDLKKSMVAAQDNQQVLTLKQKEKKFGTRTFFLMDAKDPELKVEQWMLDDRIWNSR